MRFARVEGGEHARVPVGVDAAHGLEAGVARQVHHDLAALAHRPVLGGDRRLLHPLLESSHALVVAFIDLGPDGRERVLGKAEARKGERGGGRGGGADELASGGSGHARSLAQASRPAWR